MRAQTHRGYRVSDDDEAVEDAMSAVLMGAEEGGIEWAVARLCKLPCRA